MYQPLPMIHVVVGVGLAVGTDRLEDLALAVGLAEVALRPIHPARQRMDVGVLEARA